VDTPRGTKTPAAFRQTRRLTAKLAPSGKPDTIEPPVQPRLFSVIQTDPRARLLATFCVSRDDHGLPYPHCGQHPTLAIGEQIIGQVVTSPPAYQATPGRPVYIIHTRARAVLIGEEDLTGPLRDLAMIILATDDPA